MESKIGEYTHVCEVCGDKELKRTVHSIEIVAFVAEGKLRWAAAGFVPQKERESIELFANAG